MNEGGVVVVLRRMRRHEDLRIILCSNNVINLCIIFMRTYWFELKIEKLFWLELFLGIVLFVNLIILTSPEIFDNIKYVLSYSMTLLWGFVALTILGNLLYVSAILSVLIFGIFLYFGYFSIIHRQQEHQVNVYWSPNIIFFDVTNLESIARTTSLETVHNLTKNDINCSICLESFNSDENNNNRIIVELLRCNHIFHKHCLELWIQINRTCPLCRIEL